MKRKKGRSFEISLEKPKTRWVPDPHKRARVIPNKHKLYNRKALRKPDGLSDILGL